VPAESQFHGMIGVAPVMQELFRQLQLLASLDATVCLEGESGTGKRLAAEILHQLSPRSEGPCLFLDVPELAPTLFEGHLFGCVEEAFAGVLGSHEGLALQASGGTLIIEEVGDLAREHQVILRRFLMDRLVRPVGGREPRAVDVRVLCTVSRDLSRELSAGRFDPDLYLTLRVFTVRLPALRERREDLPLLIQHLLTRFMRVHAKQIRGLSPEAATLLATHPWPGNMDELINEIERVVILTAAGEWVEPEVLSERVRERGTV